jgi:hypothetical protein
MANNPIDIQKFADDLIEKSGFSALEGEAKSGVKQHIIGEALNRVGLLVVGELSEEQTEEYGEMIAKSENPQADPAIADFINKSIPDFQEKFASVLSEYENEFVSEAQKAIKHSPDK